MITGTPVKPLLRFGGGSPPSTFCASKSCALVRASGRRNFFAAAAARSKSARASSASVCAHWLINSFQMYPPCGFSPSFSGLFPFYELCAQYKAPVVVHIGPTSPALSFDTSNPFLLDEAARKFPNVNFIMAHSAVSFTEESAMMCAFRPNIYLDISGYQSSARAGGAGEAVKRVVSRGINHKVLFGTDWPVFRLQGDQHSFVEAIISEDGPLSDLSETEKALILRGNAERLLGSA